MKSESFCYWLQGYFEINGNEDADLSTEQVQVIKNHLALVFKHEIDPALGGNPEELQAIHDGAITHNTEIINTWASSIPKPPAAKPNLMRC